MTAQADLQFRKTAEDLARIKVRNTTGSMPTFVDTFGPDRVPR